MTKPKPKRALQRFTASPYKLSQKARDDLKSLLHSQDENAIDKVEDALGLGFACLVHLDEIPRPADYVTTFAPIRKGAKELLNAMIDMGDYYWEQFEKRGVDANAVESSLLSLFTVADGVVNENKGKSSKGRQRNDALCETIRRLRIIFREHYRGPVSG